MLDGEVTRGHVAVLLVRFWPPFVTLTFASAPLARPPTSDRSVREVIARGDVKRIRQAPGTSV